MRKNQNGQSTESQIRPYRNAELVAKYYNAIGILIKNKDLPISVAVKYDVSYEPKDFQQQYSSGLQLIDQAALGEEQVVMFKEKEIKEKLKNLQNQIQ